MSDLSYIWVSSIRFFFTGNPSVGTSFASVNGGVDVKVMQESQPTSWWVAIVVWTLAFWKHEHSKVDWCKLGKD